MKKLFCLLAITAIAFTATAQYYYNDIRNIQKLNAEYSILKSSGYRLVDLKSFEDDDSPSEGFFCEKKFNNDFSESSMISKSYITGESVLNSTYMNGRIVKSSTETPNSANTTTYQYDSSGNLLKVTVTTTGSADSASFTEERSYEYNDRGLLTGMKRIKNGHQVATIDFKRDDKGNVIEETPENNSTGRKYYYYYDDNNRLTDIVHFNVIAQKLLPDYMFLYEINGAVQQMISVDETGRNYFIWKYSYTTAGLPEIQKCYSKEKRLLGTIQYEYR